MIINGKLIYVIQGLPNNGKTYLAHYLSRHYRNCKIMHLDIIFSDWIYIHRKDLVPQLVDIFTLFNNLNENDKGLFYKYTLNRLNNKVQNNLYNVIVVEGFICGYIDFSEFQKQNVVVSISTLRANEHEFIYCCSGKQYRNCEEIIYSVNKFVLHILTGQTTYQNYAILGQQCTNSNSFLKYHAMRIGDKIERKKYLDIGCNTGYFVYKSAMLGAYRSVGIDAYLPNVITGSQYCNILFQLTNTEFHFSDIYKHDESQRFDVISCASTFHYFRERQKEFFDKCDKLLETGGLLALECGISEQNPDEIFVEHYSRNIDDQPCYYPNEKTLLEYAYKYVLLGKYPSIDQSGDKINRYVFHFLKIK